MKFDWIGKSEDGNTITLNKLKSDMFILPSYFSHDWELTNSESIRMGAVIDVETTGLDQRKDHIIEIGIRVFKFNRLTGELLSLDSSYSGFQDPGVPLSNEVKAITGITDEMLRGKIIDWIKINEILSRCQIIIAHNASFDRPFIDKQSLESKNKIWGCSLKQVDWNSYGFHTQKLDVLSIYHGFFTDAHRALNDSDALIYLLSLKHKNSKYPYLFELLNNAKKPTILVSALYAPYDMKDLLKNRNYRWDAQNRVWSKIIYKDQYEVEIQWLTDNIYSGNFKGSLLEIQPINSFKNLTLT